MDLDTIFWWIVLILVVTQRLVRSPRRRLMCWKANWPGMCRYPVDAVALLATKLTIVAVLLLYLVFPQVVAPFTMYLAHPFRLVGALVALSGIALLWWADDTLGDNLSVTLQIKTDHKLVTTGPYSWVRHPVYTATLIFFVGISVAASSLLVAALCIGGMLMLLIQRIPQEEKMMLDHFGEQYRRYSASTGKLLPRLY